jgi:hypothetical protein
MVRGEGKWGVGGGEARGPELEGENKRGGGVQGQKKLISILTLDH